MQIIDLADRRAASVNSRRDQDARERQARLDRAARPIAQGARLAGRDAPALASAVLKRL